MSYNPVSTPTQERCVTSYPVRRAYRPGVVYPPAIDTVADAIDIHCHAHPGQQDALALAKYASQSGMKGILYKTIVGRPDGASAARDIQDELDRWAETEKVAPIKCWAGALIAFDGKPPSLQWVKSEIDAGVAAVWLPVFNHANTLNKVGGRRVWWDSSADPDDHTPPLPWDEAMKYGHYLLDEHANLKREIRDIMLMCAERGVALFFGHATHPEIFALAEEVDKLGYERAVIDHPYSPFVDLTIPEMKQLANVGITLNFTFDELSPLLGVDPARMYQAIREVGPEHFTLSSDAGEPLFPNSVECMRLIRGYMEAFGLTADELRTVCTTNPAKVMGLN
jgi:hypothetical protein